MIKKGRITGDVRVEYPCESCGRPILEGRVCAECGRRVLEQIERQAGEHLLSLVNDLLMPVIGALFGGVDFTTLRYVIREADEAAGIAEASIKYGSFLQAIVNFLLIAIVIFLLVKGINKMRRKKEEPAPAPAPAPEPSDEVKLLTEIRDALKK